MKKYLHLMIVVSLTVLVPIIYFGTFTDNFFAYDSFRYIENIFHGPRTVMLGYNAFRVVSNFTWYPLYYLSGFNPLGYNLFNDCLYALNALLLYLFTRRLWDNKDLSLLISILFLLNVTAVDAVFWHMSLSTLLCAALYLLTVTVYVEYRKSDRKSLWWIALLLYVVAMFTKEDAASLPFVIGLIDLLYFQGLKDLKGLVKRIASFSGIVVFYLLSSNLVFYFLNVQPETAKFFKIRPIYSLLAGYSVFILSPEGILKADNPFIYVTLVAIALTVFLVKDKKLLLFGYAFIFLTFLPQSLSSIGQFEPKYIFNSISRLLYLPVAGASIVIAAVLMQLKKQVAGNLFWSITVVFFIFFFSMNYARVQTRGNEWRREAAPVAQFLAELKKVVPAFPRQSYVFVIDPPTGRAYVQQSLRAFFQNPEITWIVDPERFRPRDGDNAFLINTFWGMNGVEGVAVRRW